MARVVAMRSWPWMVVVGVLAGPGVVGAYHGGPSCVPTQADPVTVIQIDTGAGRYYWEERGNPAGTNPPVPLTGLVLGDGTWLYQETNGLGSPPEPGSLQRGFYGYTFGYCYSPPPVWLPCVHVAEDPIYDESCGHGPDTFLP